jgi:hypothetical protein
MVARWAKFERAVKEDIKYRMSKDALLEGIESNSWWKEYSSQYNHIDGSYCLAEVEKHVEENYGVSLRELAEA